MAERSPLEILLEDPLSEVTRKERRSLLAASVLGLIVVYAGLIPTRISALGIELTPSEKTVLLKAFAAVVSYFLLVFIFYVILDFLAWRARFRDAVRDRYQTLGSEREDIPYPRRVFASPANFFSALRAVFDSILTLPPGVWAAWVLFRS